MSFRQMGWCSGLCALALLPALAATARAEPVELAALTAPGDAELEAAPLDSALDCLALNVYWEARAEPRLGQIAVAAVTLNRVAAQGFPDTVCAVVRQGEERGRDLCQFSWHCDGLDDRPRNLTAWRHSLGIARLALGVRLPDPTDGALWFHSDQVHPDWPELTPVAKIGSHIFYRTASPAERAASMTELHDRSAATADPVATTRRPHAEPLVPGRAAGEDGRMTTIETDLAVLGCGVIGSSCAYHAARRGLKVAMIDAQMPSAGTSGACDGYVAVSSKKPGLMMALAAASQDVFRSLTRELRVDFEYDPAGGLLLCEDEALRDQVLPQVEAVRAAGIDMPFLERKPMLELEPELSPALVGAYHIASEAIVNPYQLNLALADGAIAAGAQPFWQTRPLGFDVAGATIQSMATTAGGVRAEQYLISAGVWSGELGAKLGLEIPVVPRRGEVVVTERGAALARHYLQSAKYIAAKAAPSAGGAGLDLPTRLGHGFVLEVNAQGQCIIGSTRAFAGFDRRTTAEGVAVIVQEALKRVPALANVRMLRAFAGLRPYVPDGKPIIGRSGAIDNLLIATGTEGDGICLSAITGQLIADLATGRRPAFDIAPLTPDRFPPAATIAAKAG
jgi:D-hydroxyproline dehydrogenase subunit beta